MKSDPTVDRLPQNFREELRRREAMLAFAHLIVRDRAGRIVFWSHADEEIYDWSASEAMDHDCFALLHTELPEDASTLEQHALATGRWEGEIAHTDRHGKRHVLRTTWTPYFDEEGELLAFVEANCDITRQKIAETELRARERDFRAFFELSGVGNVLADFTTGRFLTVNETFCRLTGYSADELAQMSAADLTLPEDAALDADGWRESLARGAPHFTIEKRYRRKDGAVIWVEATSTVIRDEHDAPVYVAGVIIDASARHQTLEEIGGARRALERSVAERTAALGEANAELDEISKKFSTLIEASPIAIIGLDAEERVEIWNPEAESLFGLRDAEVRGRRLLELPLHWDSPEAVQALLRSTDEARANLAVQSPAERRRDLEIWSAPYRGLTDAPRGHVLLLLDETEKNFLEHALLEAGEREQRRIGQELHDHLAQQLLGAAFGAQALFKELERGGSPSAGRAEDLARLINTSVLDARNMARGINPIEIDSAGLMSALQELAERSHSGAQIELRCDPPVLVHSPETSLHVFRIAQEAVNDALHHSQASRILIRLAENSGLATLQVSDNGTHSSDEDDAAEIGIGIMKYRAQAIRGELSIQQASDGGTNVTCTFANPA